MIVATEDDFRPFEFVKDGKPTGFDNELRRRAAQVCAVRDPAGDPALDRPARRRQHRQVRHRHHGRDHHQGAHAVARLHQPDRRRHALLRQAQERHEHQGDQGPERQDGRRAGRQRAARPPARARDDAEEGRRQARQGGRVHLLSGGLPGSGARPHRLRRQHDHQPEDAGDREARRVRDRPAGVGQVVSRPGRSRRATTSCWPS